MKTIHIAASPAQLPGRRAVSLAWLAEAPHRLYFFVGTVLLTLSLGWWAWEIAATWLPALGLPHPARANSATVPVGWVHALVLVVAALPAYIFGFALTAMPRWLNRPSVSAKAVLPAALSHIAGGVLLIMGFLATGFALLLVGWTLALLLVVRRIWRGPHADKRHATLIVAALTVGWMSVAAALAGIMLADHGLMRAALIGGLWGMLLPVNLVVAHRMLPFFTAGAFPGWPAWRPFTPLYVLLVAVPFFGVAAEASAHVTAALLALIAAIVAGYFSWRWQVRGVFGNRLLAMLHVSHAWLPLGLGLAAVQQAAWASGHPLLAHAPLHAITIGFLLCTAVAMVSRVSLGHSGRHVSSDRLTWWLFWILQAATVLRVLADLPVPSRVNAVGYVLAAGLVALSVLTWAARYLPLYVQARADGVAG